jgi:hypothetical protein
MRITIRVLLAAALAAGAFVHADLAASYDEIGSAVSQGTLFRVEAGAASLAAVLVLVLGRRTAYGYAFVVAASALGAILLYRYVDVGPLGPLPNMYEPVWTAEKAVAAIAAAAAVPLSVAGGAPGPGKRAAPHIPGPVTRVFSKRRTRESA